VKAYFNSFTLPSNKSEVCVSTIIFEGRGIEKVKVCFFLLIANVSIWFLPDSDSINISNGKIKGSVFSLQELMLN